MFINSIKPDNIPNCKYWWDFSDTSTINKDTGGITDLGTINKVEDKVSGLLLGGSGDFGTTFSTLPVYKSNGINGLGVAYFGSTPSHIGLTGYTDCLLTNYNYSGNQFDTGERTLFLVQQSIDTINYGMTLSTSEQSGSRPLDISTYSFSGLDLLSGTFGCILNIENEYIGYISSTGSVFNLGDSNPVSYINIVKYKGSSSYGASYAVCNFSPSIGISNMDKNKCHIINDSIGKTNLITIRSYDCTPTYSTFINSYCDVSSNTKNVLQTLSGVLVDGASQSGIRFGSLYLGNTGRVSGVNSNYLSGYCGYIGELIYYDRRLSDGEVNQVKQYLNKKWSI